MTATGIQFMADFHSGRDTGGKAGFPRRGINMIGWKIIHCLQSPGGWKGS